MRRRGSVYPSKLGLLSIILISSLFFNNIVYSQQKEEDELTIELKRLSRILSISDDVDDREIGKFIDAYNIEYDLKMIEDAKQEAPSINIDFDVNNEKLDYTPPQHYGALKKNREEEWMPKDARVKYPGKKPVHLFSCNYRIDYDGNGLFIFPGEFGGIKNEFREGEKLSIILMDGINKKGTHCKVSIFNPQGKEIYSLRKIYSQDKEGVGIAVDDFDMVEWLIKKGGYGAYKVVAEVNGEFESTDLEIFPRNEYGNR